MRHTLTQTHIQVGPTLCPADQGQWSEVVLADSIQHYLIHGWHFFKSALTWEDTMETAQHSIAPFFVKCAKQNYKAHALNLCDFREWDHSSSLGAGKNTHSWRFLECPCWNQVLPSQQLECVRHDKYKHNWMNLSPRNTQQVLFLCLLCVTERKHLCGTRGSSRQIKGQTWSLVGTLINKTHLNVRHNLATWIVWLSGSCLSYTHTDVSAFGLRSILSPGKKKMSLYDSQAPICPICQVLLRPGELQEHMETEIERLAAICLR